MPPTTPEDGAGPGKGAQTRRAILDAAIARFGRDGFRSTSVADIARDADVGGSLTYAYFPNKEALFLAALDDDAAAVIAEGTASLFGPVEGQKFSESLMTALVEAVGRHPLARRVLAGLEPHVTDRMLDLPALAELRKAITEKLRNEQVEGSVRSDIDAARVANGTVAITLSLLLAVVQFGTETSLPYARDVMAVFEAAIDATPPPR